MSEISDIIGEDGLNVLAESDMVLQRDAGMGLKEAWELHKDGVRLYTGSGLVLGHYYYIAPEDITSYGMEAAFLRARNIQSANVSYEEANGFFFFLGIGDYIGFLRHLQLSAQLQFGSGLRRGLLYVYTRKELSLYIKLKSRRYKKCQEQEKQ